MIGDIYQLRTFSKEVFDLYDLYYLMLTPVKIRFTFEGDTHEVEASEEDGQIAIRFDDRWFRTIDDFFLKAELDGELLTSRYEELFDFEVL